jgi:hypothetical protein
VSELKDYTIDAGLLHVEIRANGSVVIAQKGPAGGFIDLSRDEVRVVLSAFLMVGLDRWYDPPFGG